MQNKSFLYLEISHFIYFHLKIQKCLNFLSIALIVSGT